MMVAMSLPGFTATQFSHDGVARVVYRRGAGPGVVVMHGEIPGITPSVAAFAERVADAGFTVFVPHLFGTPGKPDTPLYIVEQLARACISREFHVLASRQASPITDWLRALCREVHAELGGKGVGAVGMCLTGNFALALMVDPAIAAPVLSQPSLPFPLSRERRAGLHLSDDGLRTVKERASPCTPVLGLRFTHDPMCPESTVLTTSGRARRRRRGDRDRLCPQATPTGSRAPPIRILTRDLVDREGHPTRERALARPRLLPRATPPLTARRERENGERESAQGSNVAPTMHGRLRLRERRLTGVIDCVGRSGRGRTAERVSSFSATADLCTCASSSSASFPTSTSTSIQAGGSSASEWAAATTQDLLARPAALRRDRRLRARRAELPDPNGLLTGEAKQARNAPYPLCQGTWTSPRSPRWSPRPPSRSTGAGDDRGERPGARAAGAAAAQRRP